VTERTALRRFLRRARGPARVAWFALVFAFVAHYLVSNWDEVVDEATRISLFQVLVVVGVTLVGKVIVSEQARVSTELVGRRFDSIEMLWMYSASDVAKYVPGGVWNVLARVKLYVDRQMTASDSARAFSLEKFWQIVGALFFGLICLLPELAGRYSIGSGPLVRTLEALALLAVWAAVTVVGNRLIAGTHSVRGAVRALVDQSLIGVALGAGLWVPLAALGWNEPLVAIGAFAIGRAAGYAAIFAPAGIGVREVVTAWALAGTVPDDIAIVALGINRILTFVADMGCFALAAFLIRRWRRTSVPAERPTVASSPQST
jgi:hypothetical protein